MEAPGSPIPDRFRSRGAVDRSEPVHPSPCGDRRPVQFPVHPRGSPPHWNDRRLRVPCIANPPSSEREISLIARPEGGKPPRTCVTNPVTSFPISIASRTISPKLFTGWAATGGTAGPRREEGELHP